MPDIFFSRNFYDAAKDSSKRSRDIKMKKTGSAARNGGPDQLFGVFFYVQIIKRKKKSHKLRPLSLDGTQNCFLNEKNINILRVRGREESAGRPFSPSSVQDIRFTPLAPFWTLGNPVLVFPKRSRQSPFGE